jgi:hypothetical protein
MKAEDLRADTHAAYPLCDAEPSVGRQVVVNATVAGGMTGAWRTRVGLKLRTRTADDLR